MKPFLGSLPPRLQHYLLVALGSPRPGSLIMLAVSRRAIASGHGTSVSDARGAPRLSLTMIKIARSVGGDGCLLIHILVTKADSRVACRYALRSSRATVAAVLPRITRRAVHSHRTLRDRRHNAAATILLLPRAADSSLTY